MYSCRCVLFQNYQPTTFDRYITETTVANKRVRYTIWDTSGTTENNNTRTLAVREADVFLLCYKISDPATLFSAINHWVPELRCHAPATPIVLVGCQSDLRTDRAVLQGLGKVGKSPVSSQQALSMSQQVQAVMYIETSAKASARGAASALEVAALTSLGQFSPPAGVAAAPLHQRQSSLAGGSSPSPVVSKKHRNRSLSVTRQRMGIRHGGGDLPPPPPPPPPARESQDSLYAIEPSESFWDQFHSPKGSPREASGSGSPVSPGLAARNKMGSLSSMSMRSKSSTLSSTKSDSSMISISTTSKTPRVSRRSPDKDRDRTEKMITIKCQRLTADKTYEEVEIEVPAPVYETMQAYSESGSVSSRQSREKRGIGTKIKCLFSKTA